MPRIVLTLGNDISTDAIYPGRFMATVLPSETPQYAFADLVEFNAQLRAGGVPPGSVILAGQNFGCGSSREQAASCLKGYDLTIVARGFGRIFLQNAVNVGLRVLTGADAAGSIGDEVEITAGEFVNVTTGKRCALTPLAPARQRIVDAGGLIPYTRRMLVAR